jgi:hypothetical protein
MLAVLEDALAACKRAPPPARPSVAGCSLRLKLGSPTARLAGRSHLRLSVTRSESNPIACVTAYVNVSPGRLPPSDAEALGGQKCGAHRFVRRARRRTKEELLRAVSPLGVARKGGSKNAGR